MWDTVDTTPCEPTQLSHDMPCIRCGHALHIYLACDQNCDCGPIALPGLADHHQPGAIAA
jgi:hypothetical protein